MTTQRMRKTLAISICFILTLATSVSWARRPTDPPHQVYKMGDFKLESGEVIKDFFLS